MQRRVLFAPPRTAGQTTKAVTEFIGYIALKKKILWHGPGYVAMPNEMYKDLVSKAYPTKIKLIEKN